jgi:hypothetical protein
LVNNLQGALKIICSLPEMAVSSKNIDSYLLYLDFLIVCFVVCCESI